MNRRGLVGYEKVLGAEPPGTLTNVITLPICFILDTNLALRQASTKELYLATDGR